MGVYVKGNPKEGKYKLIKTTDGFVLEGKDFAYACIEIDLVRCGECKYGKNNINTGLTECHAKRGYWFIVEADGFCSYGERRIE